MAWVWDGVEDQDQAQHQSQRQRTALSAPLEQRKRPRSFQNVAFIYAGNYLLSHTLSRAVPSAQRGLTSVFGMGFTSSAQRGQRFFGSRALTSRVTYHLIRQYSKLPGPLKHTDQSLLP